MTLIAESFPSPFPAKTSSDAEALMERLVQAMDSLLVMIKEETALVRQGRLREAAQIERSKGDFARSYVTDMRQLSASGGSIAQMAPQTVEAFRRRHIEFHDLLRTNMTVLGTARAVSEDLIRGGAGGLARKSAPQTCGASGRSAGLRTSNIHPLALSRML